MLVTEILIKYKPENLLIPIKRIHLVILKFIFFLNIVSMRKDTIEGQPLNATFYEQEISLSFFYVRIIRD